ncbi:hypothetical protein PMIN05_005371 [Paraphaeosphaeria minitans]
MTDSSSRSSSPSIIYFWARYEGNTLQPEGNRPVTPPIIRCGLYLPSFRVPRYPTTSPNATTIVPKTQTRRINKTQN